MLIKAETSGLQTVRPIGNRRQLHSIHGLLKGRVVEGQFEVEGQPYRFGFVPASAAIAEGRLVLSGRVTVHSPKLVERFVDGVTARLVATQGSVGGSAPRRQVSGGAPQTNQTEQKIEPDKGPETDLQPGLHPFDSPRLDELGRPIVEATGPLSFVGVLYFSISPLDGSVLGVPLDLSKVQLNLRIAPTDDLTRDLHGIFANLTDALYGERKDERTARTQLEELNRVFKM